MTKAQWKAFDSMQRRIARRFQPVFDKAIQDFFLYGSAPVVFPDNLGIQPYAVSWPETLSNFPSYQFILQQAWKNQDFK